jgi:hypothetical protein
MRPRHLLPVLLLAFPALAGGRDHRAASRPEAGAVAPPEASEIEGRVTTLNAMALNFFNNGFLGNNFANRDPSLEYPVGDPREQEHLVRAGIWVGGLFSENADLADADTLCTTATIDGTAGSFSRETESEFYPVCCDSILERSTLTTSKYYDPEHAKSYQDLICEYHDAHDHMLPTHRPLHVRVVQEILQWSFEPFDAIVLMNFHVINDHPALPVFDLYAGLYAELASGSRAKHPEWPPRGWFSRKDIAYVDSLRMVSEHHFQLDAGDCPSWAGYLLLGTRPQPVTGKRVSFNWWNWDPSGSEPETPANDVERYLALRNGATDATAGSEAPNNDPVTLLSVGPLGTGAFQDTTGAEHWILEPGDTVTVSFAFVGGIPTPDAEPPRSAEEDLAYNAEWAQTAFDLNFNIPVPPPSPPLRVEPGHQRLRLWWGDEPLAFLDPKSHTQDFAGFRVYVSELGKSQGFCRLGEFDLRDSLFYDTGFGAITAPEPLVVVENGDTLSYPYRLDIETLRDGFQYWVSVTSFDRGGVDIGSLESGISENRRFTIPGAQRSEVPGQRVIVFPNPYRGDAAWDGRYLRDRYLWFAGLPRRCTVRIYNLAGDHIRTIDFDGDRYGATDVRGIYDPTDPWNPARDVPVLSGHMAAWDLTTREGEAVASGLYIFSVEDRDTGAVERGRFLVLK